MCSSIDQNLVLSKPLGNDTYIKTKLLQLEIPLTKYLFLFLHPIKSFIESYYAFY